MKHMIIGDSHSKPGVSNERFSILGEYALKHRPDVIIDMGDWGDMESLCSYDKGTKGFEGRRYTADVEAAREARALFNAPIDKYNARQRSHGHKQYLPRKVALLGNHENRINRAMSLQPELDGVLSTSDLGAEDYGWDLRPFLEPVKIDGINYAHYFPSGVMGRPIGGVNAARRMVAINYESSTAAHSHLLNYSRDTSVSGVGRNGLVAGCCFEHHEDYAGEANKMYWRGVIMKHNVVDGDYDPEFTTLKNLRCNGV